MPKTQPRAAVVYQPHKTDLSTLRAHVAKHEAAAGWRSSLWFETDEADAGIAATRRAVAKGASVVLAAGGDGTVRAVAEALRGSGVPMAVVPQGTGNLLARNLGMPLNDLEAAVQAAFVGQSRAIDLGVITITRPDETEDEHVFLVLAGMGLDARTITTTQSKLKKHFGWLAYVDAGMRTMIKEDPLPIHYSADGAPLRHFKVYTVMIGNCGLLPGGVLLIPDAKLDDGLLDVVALRPLGPFSWLRIWHKLTWENGVLRKSKAGRKMIDLINDTRSVTYTQARTYALSVTDPEPIQLDGDDFGLALAAHGVVDPGALIVRVLADWSPAS
ncbi:MAG: diacylglycerol kinase [Leucobacter sp.]|nr:diacylglycerol kinase [Leucobacter sp.]